MSKSILIPLDGSKLGEAALEYVENMIVKLNPTEKIEVTLCHVIAAARHDIHLTGGAGMLSVPYTEDEFKEMENDAMDYLNKIGDTLRGEKVTVTCKVSISENPAEEIIKAEEEFGIDLVAMSTHGRSGISRFVIGSIADKVMRAGSVPVLMVRASEE